MNATRLLLLTVLGAALVLGAAPTLADTIACPGATDGFGPSGDDTPQGAAGVDFITGYGGADTITGGGETGALSGDVQPDAALDAADRIAEGMSSGWRP